MTKTIGIATALALVFGSTSAAFACEGFWCGGFGGSSNSYTTTTNVSVSNNASVSNSVSVSASTGGNDANGGSASADGGKANGGNGGAIGTGDAYAESLVANDVNSVDLEIVAPENCGCVEDAGSSSRGHRGGKKGNDGKKVETTLNVELDNNASVSNGVEVKAKTGYNDANGGSAEAADGQAYDLNFKRGYDRRGHDKKDGSEANGGNGGEILTGDATSASGIVNLINSVILRIL